jgi:pyridoxamine 5'-phosphate oxidase
MSIAADDPFPLFGTWLDEAHQSEINDPTAMALATVSADGRPSLRMVLLKGVDPITRPDAGFVFYTNTESRKGQELAANQNVALLFHWKTLRRQIRIEGAAQPVSAAEADAYYQTRPRLSRLGAWASDQSRPLAERAVLEQRLQEAEQRFPGESIPRPDHWSGYRVVPTLFEFWTDQPFRLHNRLNFARNGVGWARSLLYP